MVAPKYDPEELDRQGLTEEQAEGIRLAMEEIDQGKGIPGDQAISDLVDELEELTRGRERRAG